MKTFLEFLVRGVALAGAVVLGIGVSESSQEHGVIMVMVGSVVVVVTLPYLVSKARSS